MFNIISYFTKLNKHDIHNHYIPFTTDIINIHQYNSLKEELKKYEKLTVGNISPEIYSRIQNIHIMIDNYTNYNYRKQIITQILKNIHYSMIDGFNNCSYNIYKRLIYDDRKENIDLLLIELKTIIEKTYYIGFRFDIYYETQDRIIKINWEIDHNPPPYPDHLTKWTTRD